jgi:membrane protease YdiL (CAAX protease family)
VYSVVFGIGHIEQGYAAAIATGTLGMAWAVIYWRRQSIVAPMVSHAGFNLAQLVKYVSIVR